MILPFPIKIFKRQSEWILTQQFQVLILSKAYGRGSRVRTATMTFNWEDLKDGLFDLTLCLLPGSKHLSGGEFRSKRGGSIGLEGDETLLARRKEASK